MTLDTTPKHLLLASRSPRRALLLREAGFGFSQFEPPFADPADPNELFACPNTRRDGPAVAQRLAELKARSVPDDAITQALRQTFVNQPPQATPPQNTSPMKTTASPQKQPRKRLENPAESLPERLAEGLPRKLPKELPGELAGELPGGAVLLTADTIGITPNGELVGTPETVEQARVMLRSLLGQTHTIATGVALRLVGDEPRSFADTARVNMGQVSDAALEQYLRSGQWAGKAGGYNLAERVAEGWPITVEGDPGTVMGLPMRRLAPMLVELGVPQHHASTTPPRDQGLQPRRAVR